jgi:hypothetical protein
MFKVGKVLNYYEKIGITIIQLTAGLTVGDNIKIYKDGELVLYQKVDSIIMNQKDIPFAKSGDVIALVLNEKIKKGSEVFRIGQLGA